MGGGNAKGAGSAPRSRDAEAKQLLRNPATAFCLPETVHSAAIESLIDAIDRRTGARR